jgi:hypothetical protein
MGKKEKKGDIYEQEQNNRKFRKKSKKLEKREKQRKNKKKTKKERNEKRKLIKYIKKVFKENKQEIDTVRLFEHCFDLEEIEKQVKKMLTLNREAVTEIPDLFKSMEGGRKEVNLAGLEDKNVQKYLLKLMKNLKISQNPRNPFSYRITTLFQQPDPKKKITSDSDDIIAECLSSYYYLVKAIFEYENYVMSLKEEAEKQNIEKGEKEDNSESDGEESNSEDEQEEKSEISQENDYSGKNLKDLDREKLEMDYEYELIEQKLGKNAELINKAFNKILQEDSKKKPEQKLDDNEEELVGPPIPKFLANTMSLLNTEEDEDENLDKNKSSKKDAFSSLLNKNTFQSSRKGPAKLPSTAPRTTVEPINKESYDRLIAYERERMNHMADALQDYESQYRRTSLMEEYQQQKAKEKNKMAAYNDAITREFDRDKDLNVGRVDSKRAMAIMRDQKGLQGRFEAKEKYIGY